MEKANPTNDKKLMIVDDDTFLLSIYAARFAKSGFAVSQFASPVSALEKIKSGLTPDILLLDVLMPEMNGIDLLEKIRSEKLLPPSVTIILLTNQSDSVGMTRARTLGIDGYIIKATSIPAEVVEKVVELSGKHQSK